MALGSQFKRKIKIVTIGDNFFNLFSDGSDDELLKVKDEMSRRPCLILVKVKYLGKNYTFALPFRSNINKSADKSTYYSLPTRPTTRDGNRHGIHYIKAFPVDQKYFMKYNMGGDFREEYILAKVEKDLPKIIQEFKQYIENYEKGIRERYCIDIDNAIKKQNL